MDAVVLEERDANGALASVYYDLGGANTPIATATSRIAVVAAANDLRARTRTLPRAARLAQLLVGVFLPTGYPDSVKPDYTDYQIFDSIQAFASSIAALLGNRAVLTAVGVGDNTATSTSALFITVVQETLGRLATITFAWRFGSMLEQECKKMRFAADLVNNAALVCDCLAPAFLTSQSLKIAFLCASGVLRAVCGVMANGSKAALTLHFTNPETGSISDVAAKDSSQETVISLLGMLAGTLIVPYINTSGETVVALVLLISVHLWTNYIAVSAVVLDTLNRHRANIVFSAVLDSLSPAMMESDLASFVASGVPTSAVPTRRAVARLERILEWDGALRWGPRGQVMGTASFGSFTDVMRMLPPSLGLRELLALFGGVGTAQYVLWYDAVHLRGRRAKHVRVRIALVDRGHGSDVTSDETYYRHDDGEKSNDRDTRELRAWVHALFLARSARNVHGAGAAVSEIAAAKAHEIARAGRFVDALFAPQRGALGDALAARGWDLARGRCMVVSGAVPRVRLRRNSDDGGGGEGM
ncbi:vitamin B6 photo-protection and homoeostasis-domain-containing protein [Limtongia smithiae]|uniref:vitamin B6 photo-protection and homoeostasis-domain-containing protein n=1 Tax=Limtongia smithiae TaxID=1125753 RepID=UPI0034CFFEF3